MADVFDEVDDDLRHEKLEKWWKKHGQTLIALAIGIVIGTAIFVAVQSYRTSQAQGNTEQLASLASQINDVPEEKVLADLAAFGREEGGDTGALALLKAAEAYISIDQKEKASALYSEVYSMGGVDIFYNDLALLMKVQLTMDQKDSRDIIAELKPLASDSRPLRFSARELMAYIYLSEDKTEEARKIFEELSTNPATPQSLKQRAKALSSIAPAAGDEDGE